VYPILQLRLHPAIQALQLPSRRRPVIKLDYVTRRGPWYFESWKGDERKSGGLLMNIGVHFFDTLIAIYGPVLSWTIEEQAQKRVSGVLRLEHADVQWNLSVDRNDLPEGAGPAYRCMTVDGVEVDFSAGFTDLHTESYRQVLDGQGFGVADCLPSLDLIHKMTTKRESPPTGDEIR